MDSLFQNGAVKAQVILNSCILTVWMLMQKGNVYVNDAELFNIQKFTINGGFVTKWGGTEGNGPTEFSWLESVDVDSTGNVYVGRG